MSKNWNRFLMDNGTQLWVFVGINKLLDCNVNVYLIRDDVFSYEL